LAFRLIHAGSCELCRAQRLYPCASSGHDDARLTRVAINALSLNGDRTAPRRIYDNPKRPYPGLFARKAPKAVSWQLVIDVGFYGFRRSAAR